MRRYRRVNIEISNICNLQCNFCPEVHREKKIMNRELFSKIIHQVAPLTDEVCLHLMGEPLGHPDLSAFIDICEKADVPINFTTNGTLLADGKADLLLRSIIRQVNFSVQSFEANFGDQDVSRYLEKIFKFTRKALVTRPDLYINYRLWDLSDPVSLTEKNQQIREKIEQEFSFKIDRYKIDLRRKKGYLIQGRLYLNFDSRFEWPALGLPLRASRGFCHGLSNHFGIHADGAVVPCCLDKEAVLNLGNCESASVLEILGSERAQKIKSGFERKELVEDLCKRCSFIERFDDRSSKETPDRERPR
jgi:radical SAM protein with 4Fe4S-binding SPASM domain